MTMIEMEYLLPLTLTENRLQQFQLSAAYQVNDKFSVTGQVYRRNSKRDSQGADVYTDFENQTVKRNLAEGEEFTCLFETTNDYNLPDYAVTDIPMVRFCFRRTHATYSIILYLLVLLKKPLQLWIPHLLMLNYQSIMWL